ncbi:hypothetical protein [Salipiger abyssi]|uniref:hypothetical protein n=1 Tax=Salipiger abyssi TaxID=1250539 RepID=UPI000976B9BD|nr:hypothetical protein [Salipiger abyssi]
MTKHFDYSRPLSAAILGLCVLAPVASAAQDQPPVPECNARETYGCYVPAAPEPGTDIPEASVNFSMRPSADNSFYIVAIDQGWFGDAGITILPEPTGFQATNDNAIPLILNGTNDVGAMYGGSVVQALPNNDVLKMIMLTDDFVGYSVWADPELGLKTVDDYMAEGQDFKEALHSALAPLVAEEAVLATTPLSDTRPFIDITFEMAGYGRPELLLLDDPDNRVMAQSGRVQFSLPTSASAHLEFSQDGWTNLVSQQQIIDNAEGADKEAIGPLIQTVGVMANRNWVEENPNTTLRLVSVVFRTIEAIMEDGGEPGGLMSIAVPFINAYSGMNLDEAGLYEVYTRLDPLSPWDTQGKYFEDLEDPRYYRSSYSALIDELVETDVMPEGFVPDDAIWAGQIFATLKWYREAALSEIEAAQQADLSDAQAELLSSAEQQFEWFNFLDAYRMARGVNDAG